MTDFSVVEIFGPTLQGEGQDIGMPCYFIRFGGCDFRCGQRSDGTWRTDGWVCDSLHAVLPEEVRLAPKLTDDEIVEALMKLPKGPMWVIFSGGNPLLHELGDLVEKLHHLGFKVAVETQGTVWKDWLNSVDLVTVSPKPPSTFQKYGAGSLDTFMAKLVGPRVCVKIVIWDEDDIKWAELVYEWTEDVPFYLSVCNDWHKPDSVADLLERQRWIHETIIKRESNLAEVPLLPQLHVLLWGNSRGR
jgi:7-carboxy-7-deazaguanine synthase